MKGLWNVFLQPFKMVCSIFDNDDHRIVSKRGSDILGNGKK